MTPSPPKLDFNLGPHRLSGVRHARFGIVFDGQDQRERTYLDAVLQSAEAREGFFALVEQEGIVVCKNLEIDAESYRRVGGKRNQGKMSQGELFHHDGCYTPEKPRILEIRCPHQIVVRSMLTATAFFPDVVKVMLLELSPAMVEASEAESWVAAVHGGREPEEDWEFIQGALNRTLRALHPEVTRTFFREVDYRNGAYLEPWTMGESRFMANGVAQRSVQHRRACHPPWTPGTPNGHLLKRWPAEELPPAEQP